MPHQGGRKHVFLSIQAQDFIEEEKAGQFLRIAPAKFLSIQAQDFIEDDYNTAHYFALGKFLSIQAQDFIEET